MRLESFVDLVAREAGVPADQVDADSELVAQLRLKSVETLQVVQRVEDELGERLVGLDLAGVRTVGELYRTLMAGRPSLRRDAARERPPHELAMERHLPEDPMVEANTLVDLVRTQAERIPDRVFAHVEGEDLTFGTLGSEVRRFAAALARLGVQRGERVVLVLPNISAFLFAYYGVQALGAVAVPTFHLPQPDRISRVVRSCGAVAVVTARPLARPVRKRLEAGLAGATLAYADVASLAAEPDADWPSDGPGSGELAMLQYTSGTTGEPKGVMLTHRALLANLRQNIAAARFTEDDVFVSWLPVHHDLGLIMATMCPLYLGARLRLLPSVLSVAGWLAAMTEERATVTGAPDFAYRYVLRTCADPSPFDLSSLRMALTAAEPVRADTVRRFEALFGIPGCLRPAYGLAEASVGVTFSGFEQGLTVDAHGNVDLGLPLPGVELSIRDDGGRRLPAGTVGEVCFTSPSQTDGYFYDVDATAALFHGDGAVRTGDLGYLRADGRLTLVDRLKNVLNIGGRTLSPREVEEIVQGVDGVLGAMALGVDRGDDLGEQIHVVVELATGSVEPAPADVELSHAVRDRVEDELGVRPVRVHVVGSSLLPRTANGKLQYAVMRETLGALRRAVRVPEPRLEPAASTIEWNKRVRVIDEGFQRGIAAGLCHLQLDADQTLDGRSFVVDGVKKVNFASCSYLGLEMHPDVKLGIIEATTRHGASFIMSRAYASSPLFGTFETLLDEVFGAPCVVTPSTTLGTLSFMQTFVNEGDTVLLDASVHNSVQLTSSTALQNGVTIETVGHNDLDAVRAAAEEAERRGKHAWYCVDGIYSMHGDFCPLPQLLELLDACPALHVYADDAHGMSMLGTNGRGFVLGDQERLHPRMVVAVSLSKAFGMGTGGALIFPNEEWRRMLRTTGPTMIFSTPVPPPMLGAGVALARLHLSDEVPRRQAALQRTITRFRDGLRRLGLTSPSDPRSPVQFIHVGSDAAAAAVAADVVEQGFFINLAAYPAVAPGASGLRLTMTTLQTEADIEGVLGAIAAACERAGVIERVA